ncbi:MAG: N-6 DNA methylase [Holophagaceae bacterium]|nr:N-6 DNA methylase [Holophagaceae bacterium]
MKRKTQSYLHNSVLLFRLIHYTILPSKDFFCPCIKNFDPKCINTYSNLWSPASQTLNQSLGTFLVYHIGMSATRNILAPHEAISVYLSETNRQYQTGRATEHTYRSALQVLLSALLPNITVSNEPSRQECGAPDYVLLRQKDNIPIAYIEAKDIGDPDLEGKNKNREQFNRYKNALDSIIFTDYLDFIFCKGKEIVERVRIAEIRNQKIAPNKDQFDKFHSLITAFGESSPQTISTPDKLAHIMANKARLMAKVFEESLIRENGDSTLTGQMIAFKDFLIHDITPKDFADLYAQTITYGMFAARIRDTSIDTFSRKNAAELIPKTNPFLRKLFQSVAGYDLDERISWIVDDLAEAFRATDIRAVMKGFGHFTQQTDPIIHFYEDFLSEYDPKLRKNRGVWYTPQPVVNFIIRAVDEILQTEFGLQQGLADTSKVDIEIEGQGKGKTKAKVHKVQILDPALGTGTFLAETARLIHEKFIGQQGQWQNYVEQHLIPRLNGFEILMAPYAMAHLKLDMLLGETGYTHNDNQRLRIFLTNSLEEHHPDTGTLFAQFLANEAKEANTVKRDTPVMVVMGNPPYSVNSWNKGGWIADKLEDYKKEPDSGVRLMERNSKSINDDYVKFIRMGQHFVDKNQSGILAYIANHGFIDNPTFRGMRWSLLQSFDKIYIIDLHGNAKKKETAPDGTKDENVFEIQQGVSINIFVKTGKKKKGALAEIYHFDLFGLRQVKYDYLLKTALSDMPFTKLQPTAPEYFFVPKDYRGKKKYESGFLVTELFITNSMGITTARDEFTIHSSPEAVADLIKDFFSITDEEAREKYALGSDVREWSIAGARVDLQASKHNIVPIAYRPFDTRYTNYSGVTRGFHCRPRQEIMKHLINGKNYAFCSIRINRDDLCTVLVVNQIVDKTVLSSLDNANIFPLYLYPDTTDEPRTPNLAPEIVNKIAKNLNLEFEPEKTGNKNSFTPIDLLDYIYAMLHSPNYREKYKEFLKIDFPRVPYPTDAIEFRRLARLGEELRLLHLMEHPALNKLITKYPISGSDIVEKLRWEPNKDGSVGKVWINDTQYFDKVPLIAWEFYVGGYQPAQKWLKDRKGRKLTFEDINHYQRIIVALNNTDEIMAMIDGNL